MKLPILCYHKVGPVTEEGRRLNIEPEALAYHAAFFLRRGYRTVLARDLAEGWPERAVCFTFDDGYESTLTHGVEALRSVGAVGSIYVVTDFVGKQSSWDPGNERPLADWARLREAVELGFEIGNHTKSHARLGDLGQAGQIAEIRAAHDALARNGIESASFCLPYGSRNDFTSGAIRAVGYRVGLALSRRAATPNDDLVLLPRVVIGFSDRVPQLLYKLQIRPLLPKLKRRPDYVP